MTTNFVFDETYTLFLTRLGHARAVAWGHEFLSGRIVQSLRVEEPHEVRAWHIILEYGDKSFSYTDATSFAVMESIGCDLALSRDSHFRQFGSLRPIP